MTIEPMIINGSDTPLVNNFLPFGEHPRHDQCFTSALRERAEENGTQCGMKNSEILSHLTSWITHTDAKVVRDR